MSSQKFSGTVRWSGRTSGLLLFLVLALAGAAQIPAPPPGHRPSAGSPSLLPPLVMNPHSIPRSTLSRMRRAQ